MHSTKKNIIDKQIELTPEAVCNKYLRYPDQTGKRIAEGGLRLQEKYKQSIENKPLVTVITVVYNNEKTLERCIESVLNQTYDNIEYIVIDGGSTDGTLDIIKKYEDSIDYYISEPDEGIYYAMNKGIALASGDYLNFMNSDDWFYSFAVQESIHYLLSSGAAVSIADADIVNEKNEIISVRKCAKFNEINLIKGANAIHQTIFCSNEYFNKLGEFDTSFKIAADSKFILQLFSLDFSYCTINNSILRFSNQGVSSINLIDMHSEHAKMLQEFNPDFTLEELHNLNIFCGGYKDFFDKNCSYEIIENILKERKVNEYQRHFIHNQLVDWKFDGDSKRYLRGNVVSKYKDNIKTAIIVSIIVPVYNSGKYLRQCLDSVVSQTLKDIEIIIINDCSPDPQDDVICQEYSNKDLRIKYIKNQENKGVYISRIIGMQNAIGEYIGFVDADDYIEPQMYKILYDNAIRNNVDIVEIIASHISSQGNKIGIFEYSKPNIEKTENPFGDILDKIKWNHWSKLYKNKIIKESLKLMPRERIEIGEDLLTNLLIFYNANSYIFLDLALYNYRTNNSSATYTAINVKSKIQNLINVHIFYDVIFRKKLNNEIFDLIKNKILTHIKEAVIYYGSNNFYTRLEVKELTYNLFAGNNFDTDFLLDFSISDKDINVSILSTEIKGGAGIASYRLHKGLLDQSVNSYLLTQFDSNENVGQLVSKNKTDIITSQNNSDNIFLGNTFFNISNTLYNHDLFGFINYFNIIHLHWISRFLSVENIAYLSHLDKPIVWTFHDKNPLTGGCHYFHGCEGWRTDCMNCPQLINNYDNYPAKILETKKKYINFKNITVIVLNKHFKKLVEESPLFNESRIEIIPNSIDTDKYKQMDKLDKHQIRKKLGLEINKKYLFYVAAYASTVKGYKEFEQAIKEYSIKYSTDNIEILLAGNLPKERNIDLPFQELGHVNEEKIIELYNASDVTVLSSIEDNLPNVMLESLSCGTPVVGFKVGGIPDMIEDGYNGYTVELGDIGGLADSINKILETEDLSANCRKYAEDNLRLDIQAKRYKELYEDLLKNPPQATGKANDIPEVFPETAPTLVKLMSDAISQQEELIQNNKWYRFGQMSKKRKIWTIGRVVSKKIKIYWLLKPFAETVKRILNKKYKKY